MIPPHVALVDASGRVERTELEHVVGALNEQVLADFAPPWWLRASVGSYVSVPPGTWQIVVQTKLDQPDALGYHTDDTHNQPISYVEYGGGWTITASHELLEMLADPFGNRMHAARLPEGLADGFAQFGLTAPTDRVNYLVEVCDPPENASYEVGGVAVSDFVLPAWYRSAPSPVGGYSHTGACTAPRQITDGGYVSFANASGEWFQVFRQGAALQVSDLGRFDARRYRTLREFSDVKARAAKAAADAAPGGAPRP